MTLTDGDAFGWVNAFVSLCAFAAMVITLQMQRKELRLQRKEMVLQRKEIDQTQEIMEDQAEIMKLQGISMEEQVETMRQQQLLQALAYMYEDRGDLNPKALYADSTHTPNEVMLNVAVSGDARRIEWIWAAGQNVSFTLGEQYSDELNIRVDLDKDVVSALCGTLMAIKFRNSRGGWYIRAFEVGDEAYLQSSNALLDFGQRSGEEVTQGPEVLEEPHPETFQAWFDKYYTVTPNPEPAR